jgi:hypothetical protein
MFLLNGKVLYFVKFMEKYNLYIFGLVGIMLILSFLLYFNYIGYDNAKNHFSTSHI